MAAKRPLTAQPNMRIFDIVRRVSEPGANKQPILGLVWRVAGLEDSEDDMSLSSDEDEKGDDPTPPDNHAQVAWMDYSQEELTLESEMKGVDVANVGELVPVDRNLAAGDIVAAVSDPLGQTGIVVGSTRLLDLQLSDGRVILNMPLTTVQPVLDFYPEQYILHNGWLGQIQEVVHLVTVRLLDGTVARFVCKEEQRRVQPRHSVDFLFRDERSCPYYPGQTVSVDINTPLSSQARILQGRALRCPYGRVLSVAVDSLTVEWITPYGDTPPPMETVQPEGCIALKYTTFGTLYWHLGTCGLWVEPQTFKEEESRSLQLPKAHTRASQETATQGRSRRHGGDNAGSGDKASTAPEQGDTSSQTPAGSKASKDAAQANPILRGGDNAGGGNKASAASERGKVPTFAEVVARQPAQPSGPASSQRPAGQAHGSQTAEEGSGRQGGGWAASVRSVVAAMGGGRSAAQNPLPASPTGQKRAKRRTRNRSKKNDAASKHSEANIPVTAQVIGTHTTVDIKWQDGRIQNGVAAVDVLPRQYLDEFDFWPDDFVEEVPDDLDSPGRSGKRTAKRVGVVKSYNSVSRTAEVAWLSQAGGLLQQLKPDTPSVTLPVYSIVSHPNYAYAIGDVLYRVHDGKDFQQLDDEPVVGELIGFRHGQLEVLWVIGPLAGKKDLVSPDQVAVLNKEDDDEEGPARSLDDYEILDDDEDGSWCTASNNSQAEEPSTALETASLALDTRIQSQHAATPSNEEQPGAPTQPTPASPSPRRISPTPVTSLAVPCSASTEQDLSSYPSGASPEGALGITFGSFGSEELDRIVSDSLKKRQAASGAGATGSIQRAATAAEPSSGGTGVTGAISRLLGAVNIGWSSQQQGISQERTIASTAPAPAHAADGAAGSTGVVREGIDSLAAFPHFEVLETLPDDHMCDFGPPPVALRKFQRVVLKEWDSLRENLPDSIWVRAFEPRMDLLRVCIKGAADTPYHNHLFFFDLKLPADYPASAPQVLYHSWGLRVNPNLYENGKVCLSLLGTWAGRGSEMWSPASTILQVLISIQGLVLVAKPYYNEAGYERQADTAEGELNSRQYNETAFWLTCRSTIHCLRRPLGGFEGFIKEHYEVHRKQLVTTVKDVISGKAAIGGTGPGPSGDATPSDGIRQVLGQLLPKFCAELENPESPKLLDFL